ncbi:hypothetical protein ACVII0_000136 [Sinorhizobium meliloti]
MVTFSFPERQDEHPVQTVEIKSDPRTAEGLYRVRFYETCGYSPAWELVPHEMIELQETGFHRQTDPTVMFIGPCMVAIDENGNAMALLTYYGKTTI